jgi:hypothetical protein
MHKQHTHDVSLVETLEDVFSHYRPAYGQDRVFRRSCSLALGATAAFARKTMTQVLITLGEADKDWTASYRLLSKGRFDARKASDITLHQTFAYSSPDQPYTMVVDGTRVNRSSLKMPGTCWGRGHRTAKWQPGLERCQRFENICWLTPPQEGYCRAVPLIWEHIPTEKSVASNDAPKKEWEAAREAALWVREHLDAAGRTEQPLLVFADGSYDVNKLWSALGERTYFVVRCGKNRSLRFLPSTPESPRRGARRKYGAFAPSLQWLRSDQAYWQSVTIPVRGKKIQIKCRVCGPYLVQGAPNTPLMLILVKGYHRLGLGRQKRRPACQYLVNAVHRDGKWQIPFSLQEIIQGTWHRWEVEVCHREIKTGFGLGQMQCWSKNGSTNSVKFMAWAYTTLILAGYKASQGLLNSKWNAPGQWNKKRRRWSLNTLLQVLRRELCNVHQFQPVYTLHTNKRQIIPKTDFKAELLLQNAAIGCSRG